MENPKIESYFNTRLTFDEGRSRVWRAINEYLQKFLPQNAAVMDIGCGYGDFINGINAEKKYAVDLNEKMGEYLRGKSITFKAQSVLSELPVRENSLDAVFASNLLEHFNDTELNDLISEIRLRLKSKGRLILIQPNIYYCYREYWDDYTHKKAFSHVSLADFLTGHNFKVVHLRKKILPFSLKSRLPKSYWLTKLYLMSPIKPMGKQMLVVAEKS